MRDKELIEGFLEDEGLSIEERDAWQQVYNEHFTQPGEQPKQEEE